MQAPHGRHPATPAPALSDPLAKLGAGWEVVKEHHLEKEYKDVLQALAFTNRIGDLAETVGHHPDLPLAWGKVKIVIWTHAIRGLSETVSIFAAKVDTLQD